MEKQTEVPGRYHLYEQDEVRGTLLQTDEALDIADDDRQATLDYR